MRLKSTQIELTERRSAEVCDELACALRHFLSNGDAGTKDAGHWGGEGLSRAVLRRSEMVEVMLQTMSATIVGVAGVAL